MRRSWKFHSNLFIPRPVMTIWFMHFQRKCIGTDFICFFVLFCSFQRQTETHFWCISHSLPKSIPPRPPSSVHRRYGSFPSLTFGLITATPAGCTTRKGTKNVLIEKLSVKSWNKMILKVLSADCISSQWLNLVKCSTNSKILRSLKNYWGSWK